MKMSCPKLPWMIDFYSTQNGSILNGQFEAAFAENYAEHLCKLNIDSELPRERLTSLIGTYGPSCNTVEALENLMEAGMSILRIKLAHHTLTECTDILKVIEEAVDSYSKKIKRVYPLGIGIDIKGPEIRTGVIKDRDSASIELKEGETTCLTSDPDYEEFVTENMIYVDYQNMENVVEPGGQIYIDNTENGQVRLSALEIVGSIIKCLIETTGRIANRASVSLDGVAIDLPLLSDEDIEAIEFFAVKHISYVFVPYVQNSDTVTEVRSKLGKNGRAIMIVAKIENVIGVYNIDNIIKVADAILISRGTLVKEMPIEKVFLAQKIIIGKCNKAGIPVICVTYFEESMVANMKPSNSEVSDIASSITDGADCFAISRETAVGKYPVESITALASICKESEGATFNKETFENLTKIGAPIEPLYAIAVAAIDASMKCNAGAILVTTVTGRSAKVLARFKPRCPIVAITRHNHIARLLNMWRAVIPIQYIKKPLGDWAKDVERRIQYGITFGKFNGFIKTGDALVIICGSRTGAGFTNTMKIVYASEFDC